MTPGKSFLQKQLEEQKFLHGISYVEQAAGSIKKITSSELAHLNQLLTDSDDPWRFESVQIQLPSGRTHSFNVLSNPLIRARDILSHALMRANNGEVAEAAVELYGKLVMEHLFRDANRRTAVLATLWILLSHQQTADALTLLKTPVGDLHQPDELEKFSALILNQIRPQN